MANGVRNDSIARKMKVARFTAADICGATVGAAAATLDNLRVVTYTAFDGSQYTGFALPLDDVDLSCAVYFRFSVAANAAGTLTPGLNIQLFDPANSSYYGTGTAFGTTGLSGSWEAITIGAASRVYSSWTPSSTDPVYIAGGVMQPPMQNHSSAVLLLQPTFAGATGGGLTDGYLVSLEAIYTPRVSRQYCGTSTDTPPSGRPDGP